MTACSRLRIAALSIAAALAASTAVAAEAATNRLTILFPDMAPFIEPASAPGQVQGVLADWINAVAEEAGMDLVWTGPVPRLRIETEMEAGEQACHPNARFTPKRAEKFKFTRPLLRPPEWVVVARRDTLIKGYGSMAELIRADHLMLGQLQGETFGPELDLLVETRPVPPLSVRGGPAALLKLLKAGRVDWIMADRTALDDAFAQAEIRPEEMDVVHFDDMPGSEPGRIMCAATVPDEVLHRLDEAIERLQARNRGR